MPVQKKTLISSMAAAKKAIIASGGPKTVSATRTNLSGGKGQLSGGGKGQLSGGGKGQLSGGGKGQLSGGGKGFE